MRRILPLAVLLIFSVSNTFYPQVVIKEKVGIKPKVMNNLPTIVKDHVFTYKLTWEPTEYSRGNIKIVTCSNDTISSGWSTSGSTSISYKGNGRHYFLILEERYYYNDYHGYGWYRGDVLPGTHWQEFIDNILIHDSYGLLGSYNGVFGKFDLKIDGLVCPSDYAVLSIDNIQWAECNEPNWYSIDPLALQIVEGDEYVSLFDTDQGTDLGSSIQLDNYTDIQNIRLKGKEAAPLVTEPQRVKLEANINGVIISEETEFPANNFTIDPWSYADTIAYRTPNQMDVYIYNDCKDLPNQIKINMEIIEGDEYGHLIDPFTGEKTLFMNNLEHYSGYLPFYFIADGNQTDSVVSVIIRISTTDSNIPHKDIKLFIRPSQIFITLEPKEIQPGDTSKIIIKKKNPDGSIENFPPDQAFEICISEGCGLGKLLICDNENCYPGSYFYNIRQNSTVLFAADSSIDSGGTVKLRVGLVKGGVVVGKSSTGYSPVSNDINNSCQNFQKHKENKKSIQKKIFNSSVADSQKNEKDTLFKKLYSINSDNEYCSNVIPLTAEYNLDELKIKKDIEILLGETKYFGVKKKVEDGVVKEIKIEEIKITNIDSVKFPSSEGDGWDWIKDDLIWSDRPINIETKGQSPIFYDKFFAKVYYSGGKKPEIKDLPDGMIRVIGRYLGKTKDNKVKLFTNVYESNADTAEIQVIRPSKLGDSENIKNGPTEQEGVYKNYNVDSLIINVAGETGILPQIIKAIMKKESIEFKPSYRYEIFQDLGGNIRNVFDSTHTYWIHNKTNEGYPKIPDHGTIWYGLHTSKNGYPEPIYAWDLLMSNEYYNLYFKGDSTRFVMEPSDSSTTAISAYKSERNKIMEFYNSFFKSLKKNGLNDQLAKDTAKIKTQHRYLFYLKKEYGGIGLDSIYAQTRIVASYGLMQLTYYSGVSAFKKSWNLNYPDNDINYLPEYINIIPINIEYGTKHFLGKLRYSLENIVYPNEDTWDKTHGLESSFWKGLYLYNNKQTDYPNPVFNYAKNYLPKK